MKPSYGLHAESKDLYRHNRTAEFTDASNFRNK
jgi:hypothetical protein